MDERRRQQQVGVELDVQQAGLLRQLGDRDGVLEQAAEVGVVAGAGARRPPPRGPQRLVADEVGDQRPQARLVDLAGEVLEEAVELLHVAVGAGQERRRVDVAGLRSGDRPHLDLQLVAEALDAAGDADEVAALEAAGEQVGVSEDPRRDGAGAVAQLQRQVGGAGAADEAVLAGAGEDGVDVGRGAQRADGRGGGHGLIMYYFGPMQPLRWERRPDGLRAPALVCAFKGWNDAGDAATTALQFVGTSLGATRFATIDPEEFFDFQATRPQVKLVDGVTREIEWPEVEIYEARIPRAPRDLILMTGSEPSMRWRTFTELILDLAEALGVQMVVSLGALLADVAHSRPIGVTGLATDLALVERLQITPSSYEGPTGIVGVLQAACQRAGIPSASLWASVPHYIASAPNPKAALALVRKLEGLVGVSVDASELESAASDYERQVGLAVQSDPEIQAFVERLEQAADEEDEPLDPTELPSGDRLASDFMRFLKQRGDRA